MTQLSELAGDIVERISHPAQTVAATPVDFALLRADRHIIIIGAVWLPSANVTGAATNNFALGLVNKGAAGAGNTAVSTVITFASGTNAAVNVPVTLPVPAPFTLAAGDVLALVRTVNGTGMASPAGVVELTYRNG